LGIEAGEDESVDRIPNPTLGSDRGRRRAIGRPERPVAAGIAPRAGWVLGPLCPSVDPAPEGADLLCGQRLGPRRHPLFRVVARHAADQLAVGTVAGPDRCESVAAVAECRCLLVEPKVGLLFLRPVAGVAPLFENRSNVLEVVDLLAAGRR